jgi:inner membrane protein involved in colicin E2 resistance
VIDPTAWRITTADFSMLLAILPTMLLNNLLRQRYRRRRRSGQLRANEISRQPACCHALAERARLD